MRTSTFHIIILTLVFSSLIVACKQKETASNNDDVNNPLDSSMIAPFIKSYPELKKYENEVLAIYRQYDYKYLWLGKNGLTGAGNTLYNKAKNMEDEGISTSFPYLKKIDDALGARTTAKINASEAELLFTTLYLFYSQKVYAGITKDSTTAMGWFLPRKEVSTTGLLGSFLLDQNILNEDTGILISQYYKLRDVLKQYRGIEKKGGWNQIQMDPGIKAYKPNDTALAIRQIRARLFITGEIKLNNGSNRYDADLVAAVKKYQLNNGFKPDSLIMPKHIQSMNVTVSERIQTIAVNMERCRWLSPASLNAREWIFVNIPAYRMNFSRDGKTIFDSPVVVGKRDSQTAIFSGKMSYLVFSPYWNLPKSIIEKEIKPAIAKDTNYLVKHHMEWNNGLVRQMPGKNNSLGLVKFMFPNENEIYFHDTPSKSHFRKENRALSHGCVRVGKPRDLAIAILENDKTWTPEKIDAAMNAGKETICQLKHKIPVYICYFTCWVDASGNVNFYPDIYKRDARLAKSLEK